jgi:hypothetical protein
MCRGLFAIALEDLPSSGRSGPGTGPRSRDRRGRGTAAGDCRTVEPFLVDMRRRAALGLMDAAVVVSIGNGRHWPHWADLA